MSTNSVLPLWYRAQKQRQIFRSFDRGKTEGRGAVLPDVPFVECLAPAYAFRAIDYPGTAYDVVYGYDAPTANGLGNRTSVKDSSGTRKYFYDSRNRVTKEVREIAALGTGGGTMTVEYSYLGLGATRQITYPNGKKLFYEYDDLMRLAAVRLDSEAAPSLVSYAYNLDGTLKAKTYVNGVTTSYSYDLAKRPDVLETVGKDKAILFRQDYDYDLVGNRTRLTGTYGEITNYEYDELDRLTKVRYLGGKSTTYSYDPNSNRTQMTYPFGSVTYRYDNDSDQLLSTQSGSQSRVEYVYDRNGSLIREKQFFGKEVVREIAFSYDYEARLVELVLDANTSQPARITYTYDDRGLRVAKNNGEESTIYITNLGNQVLYELDGAGKGKNTYFFANGEKIAQLDPAGKVLYLHNDLLGSPGIITNEAGEVVQRYTHEPFGSIIASEGSVDNSFTFNGKEYDEEAGLYYYGARYYSPLLGRFITFDTVAGELETPISQNRYIYAWANPLKYTDPDGHWIDTVFDVISLGVDIYKFAKNPSLATGLDLGADVIGLIPGVPSAAVKGVVKVVGKLDDVGDAAKAAKAVAKIDAHHPLPKFLGGDPKQALANVERKIHQEFHSLLGKNLNKEGLPLSVGGKGGSARDWANFMNGNPGAQQKAFNAVLETSRTIDARYGTNITQAVWNSIMNNKFTSFP